MIIDNSAPTPDLVRKINKLVGKPFSFLARYKMGGIGSHRMYIKAYSQGFEKLLLRNSNSLFGNVELRPDGIIIHISQRNHRFSWVLPYYQLSVFQSEGFTIHGQGEFVRFYTDAYFDKNKVFFERMFTARERILEDFR
jgi:hypothetical protein